MIISNDTQIIIGEIPVDKAILGATIIWENKIPKIPNNEIWYTMLDNTLIDYDSSWPDTAVFGATVTSHTNNNGKGVMTFDNDVMFLVHKGFTSQDKLTSMTLPNSITEIGESSFSYCISLSDITLPKNLTYIGLNAFYLCQNLQRISIPNKVTTIAAQAFEKCYTLTTITIPESVTEIGTAAFRNCGNLSEVFCKPTTPPKFGNGVYQSEIFKNCSSSLKIYVPTGTKELYRTALNGYFYNNLVEHDF